MIKFENVEVYGWKAATRGMRNPKNSWKKSDSNFSGYNGCDGANCNSCPKFGEGCSENGIGRNDYKLMRKLIAAGTDHRKFMRMIQVTVDITAPLYWWKEFDTYKVGTVANSCSTMHKIGEEEFTLDDFSHEHLADESMLLLNSIGSLLNEVRDMYITESDPIKKKDYWWQMIQLLPSSYNQRRTIMMSYEVLANICKSRSHHKLDEWSIGFMGFVQSLPYYEIIAPDLWPISSVELEDGPDIAEIYIPNEIQDIRSLDDRDAFFEKIRKEHSAEISFDWETHEYTIRTFNNPLSEEECAAITEYQKHWGQDVKFIDTGKKEEE